MHIFLLTVTPLTWILCNNKSSCLWKWLQSTKRKSTEWWLNSPPVGDINPVMWGQKNSSFESVLKMWDEISTDQAGLHLKLWQNALWRLQSNCYSLTYYPGSSTPSCIKYHCVCYSVADSRLVLILQNFSRLFLNLSPWLALLHVVSISSMWQWASLVRFYLDRVRLGRMCVCIFSVPGEVGGHIVLDSGSQVGVLQHYNNFTTNSIICFQLESNEISLSIKGCGRQLPVAQLCQNQKQLLTCSHANMDKWLKCSVSLDSEEGS